MQIATQQQPRLYWVCLVFTTLCMLACSDKEPQNLDSDVLSGLLQNCTTYSPVTLNQSQPKHSLSSATTQFNISLAQQQQTFTFTPAICKVAGGTMQYQKQTFPITDILYLTNIKTDSGAEPPELLLLIDSNTSGVDTGLEYLPQSQETSALADISEDSSLLISTVKIGSSQAAFFGSSQDLVAALTQVGDLFSFKKVGQSFTKTVTDVGKSTVKTANDVANGTVGKVVGLAADASRQQIIDFLSNTPAGKVCSVAIASTALTLVTQDEDVVLPFSLAKPSEAACEATKKSSRKSSENYCQTIQNKEFETMCKYTLGSFAPQFTCVSLSIIDPIYQFMFRFKGCNQNDSLAFCLFWKPNRQQMCAVVGLLQLLLI
ncbi:MAG: hypothetical protein AAF320_06095 [Myxococcota bacterium]